MRPSFVVVSGMAASGKTGVVQAPANSLGVPLLSKDAIKEVLFDAVGFGDWAWQQAAAPNARACRGGRDERPVDVASVATRVVEAANRA